MTREYPDRPFVGIGVVVWHEGRVLLVRRARPPRQGEWGLPGGLQELGEGVFEAARREVREETGLDIDILGIADVVDLIERDNLGRVRYHYTLIDVAAAAKTHEAVAASDAAEVVWADPDSLDAFGLWQETVRVIRRSYDLWRDPAGS